jgi:hypothetical protein
MLMRVRLCVSKLSWLSLTSMDAETSLLRSAATWSRFLTMRPTRSGTLSNKAARGSTSAPRLRKPSA